MLNQLKMRISELKKQKRLDSELAREQQELMITHSAYEGRKLFKGFAVVAALGLSVSGVVANMPQAAAQEAEFGLFCAEPAAYVEPAFQPNSYLIDNSLFNPFRELEDSESGANRYEAVKQIAIQACGSQLTLEQAKQKVDDYIAEQEKISRLARISAANAARAKSYSGSSYVRLNSNGLAMSEKIAPDWLELDENGIPTHYVKCITGHATAYYSGYITSTGTKPMQGTVAVDPRIIPYGTKMYIVSSDGKYVYGYAVAEDTGGFIYFKNGATVDLYMHSYDDCCGWGWRYANIYILE